MGEPALTLELPEQITDDIEAILGMMCFQFIRIAHVRRAAGFKIEARAEAEQAHCLFWLLRLHALHGAGWRDAANAEMQKLATQPRTSDPAAPADASGRGSS